MIVASLPIMRLNARLLLRRIPRIGCAAHFAHREGTV